MKPQSLVILRSAFPCPICGSNSWEQVGTHVFYIDDHDRTDPPLTPSERLRRRVLFEIWFPRADTVSLDSVLCTTCGFVTYCPRPSQEALDAKYRFLQRHEPAIGGAAWTSLGQAMDRQRAERVYTTIRPYIPREKLRVLDFGGGDGKLLSAFLNEGHDCFLVDYNDDPRAGIKRLGNTLDSIPDGAIFDAIICSHVLEHVWDPAIVVRTLSQYLAHDGAIYAEVPVEVWRGIPIARDPVTHLNFFTQGSFEQLFLRHGFHLSMSKEARGNYGDHVINVVMIVGRPGSGGGRIQQPADEARARLRPTSVAKRHHLVAVGDAAFKQIFIAARERELIAGISVLRHRLRRTSKAR